MPELEEKDSFQVSWNLEDLNTGMINSRKLNIKAVVMLEVRAESLYDAEAAVDVKTDDAKVEIQRRDIDVAAIAVRRKDTYRIREELDVYKRQHCRCSMTMGHWGRFMIRIPLRPSLRKAS